MRRTCVYLAAMLALSLGCASTAASDGGDTASADASDVTAGGCGTCAAGELCMMPGACMFAATCVPRSSFMCDADAGTCSGPGCFGTLRGNDLQCICR